MYEVSEGHLALTKMWEQVRSEVADIVVGLVRV